MLCPFVGWCWPRLLQEAGWVLETPSMFVRAVSVGSSASVFWCFPVPSLWGITFSSQPGPSGDPGLTSTMAWRTLSGRPLGVTFEGWGGQHLSHLPNETVRKSYPPATGLCLYLRVRSKYGEAYLVCVYSILNTLQLCRAHCKHFRICKRTTAVMRKLPSSHRPPPPEFCHDGLWIPLVCVLAEIARSVLVF